ncbi:DUF6049 family protein [Aestuariimicrobium sp. Y1814]|uniref:DUF6049 family protein n=1 Tax=Aestuariimicrobium sp. Y1814 TaxID=3418742 RepID=UPI003DA7551C
MTTTAPFRALMLALACMLVLVGAWADPPKAHAAEGLVTITLDTVTPDTLSADATVTITGTVTNTSDRPMTHVQVSFWRSTDPVNTEGDFQLLLDSPWDVPIGARGTAEHNLYNLTDEQAPTFEPGQTRGFTVQATVAELALTNPSPGTVYLMGVHVRGIPEGDGNQTVGRSRVFLPWQQAPGQATVVPVVLLTSAPALTLDGSLTDDHLAGELSGRLETLLRAAELPAATVLVDPNLVDELRTMADGYQVQGETVTPEDPRARAAAAWLQRFDALTAAPDRAGSVYRLPYGNPNLAAAASANRIEVVQRAGRALPGNHELAQLPLAVWPQDTGLTPAGREFLAGLDPDLWVEPSSLDGLYALTETSSLVTYDPTLTAGGPGPDPRGSVAQRRGRLLSQLALTPRPTVLVVRDAPDAAAALALPSWVTTAGLGELATNISGPPPATRLPAGSSPDWAAINRAHRRMTSWFDLTGSPDAGALASAQVSSRAANPRLGERGAQWLDQAMASIPTNLQQAGITLQMADTFVLGDSSGTLPITITNSSNVAVRVKVRMESDNAQRINIPDTEVVTVPANSSVSVQFTPQARTNGVVGFTAQALTEGNLAVGPPRRFSVNATNFGQVGWLIIIASGVVVLGGTAIRIKQVQRERANQASSAPEVGSATSGAPSSATPRQDTSSSPHP